MSAIVGASVIADTPGDVTVVVNHGDDLPIVIRVDDGDSGDYLRLGMTVEAAAALVDQLVEALP